MGPNMQGWTENDVRTLLRTVANLPVFYDGKILGAKLGTLLRRANRDFHPAVLGDQRLTDLLRRFPDLIYIHPAPPSGDVLIEFLDLGKEKKTEGEVEPDLGQFEHNNHSDVVDHLLWKALVNNRREVEWFVDLETLLVLEQNLDINGKIPFDAMPSLLPNRFLSIPPISQDELRNVVRSSVEELDQPELKREFLTLLDQNNWFPGFINRAQMVGFHGWRGPYRRLVVDHAKAWLQEHGIRPERFIRSIPQRITATPRLREVDKPLYSLPPAPIIPERNVRQIVQRAVARMSDEELLDLRIPLRYLFEAGR
jgi:hypothetical protein